MAFINTYTVHLEYFRVALVVFSLVFVFSVSEATA